MLRMSFVALAMAAAVLMTGCTAESTSDPVYNARGMEISRVANAMADDLYAHLYARKAVEQGHLLDLKRGRDIDDLVLPQVAITSFVDTDTYENAGHLGRVLAEMFVHELSSRGILVYEYKLTGAMRVSEDGEYIYSRDYRRILSEANVSNILSGTISRNEDGVVLVARIVDVETHLVQASATGFISYSLLPYCYQTKEKQCSLGDIDEYLIPASEDEIKDASYRRKVYDDIRRGHYSQGLKSAAAAAESGAGISSGYSSAAAREASPWRQFWDGDEKAANPADNWTGSDAQKAGVVRAVTSKGNSAEHELHEEDPIIYEGSSYLQDNRLSRDVVDQSQYQREGFKLF